MRLPVVIAAAFRDGINRLLDAPPDIRLDHRVLDDVAAQEGHIFSACVLANVLLFPDLLKQSNLAAIRREPRDNDSLMITPGLLFILAVFRHSLARSRAGGASPCTRRRIGPALLVNRAMTISAGDFNGCARLVVQPAVSGR